MSVVIRMSAVCPPYVSLISAVCQPYLISQSYRYFPQSYLFHDKTFSSNSSRTVRVIMYILPHLLRAVVVLCNISIHFSKFEQNLLQEVHDISRYSMSYFRLNRQINTSSTHQYSKSPNYKENVYCHPQNTSSVCMKQFQLNGNRTIHLTPICLEAITAKGELGLGLTFGLGFRLGLGLWLGSG